MIKLFRPLVCFDLESTGTNPAKDRIVSIACKKYFPDGNITEHISLVNPGMKIPAESIEAHGITDEMVADAPAFKLIAKSIHKVFLGCDVLTFNGNQFDIVMLAEEFIREGIQWPDSDMKSLDASVIFKKHEERTLTAAMKFYCNKPHEDAHNALADVLATTDVFLAQIERYDDMREMTVEQLHEYCAYERTKNCVDLAGKIARNEQGEYVFNFGKHLGKKVKDNLHYANWMLLPDSDFTIQTKQIVQNIVNQATGKTQTLNLI